mmetsp:Transcript_9241/g.34191  ORF Transcript_9241/g.34191 Transcript_9241/m.34191 type:complete len:246 (-) Transcript_9241:1290-2027(-)
MYWTTHLMSTTSSKPSSDGPNNTIPPSVKLSFDEHIHSLSSHLPNILFPRESARAHVLDRQQQNSGASLLSAKKLLASNDLKRYHVTKMERIGDIGGILGGEDVAFVERTSNGHSDAGEHDEEINAASAGFLLKQLAKESDYYTRQLNHFLIEDTARYASKFNTDIDNLQKKLKEDSIGFEKQLLAQWDKRSRELEEEFEKKKERYELDSNDKRIEALKEQIREAREEVNAIGAKTREEQSTLLA